MRRLRYTLVILFALTVIFLNLERLDIGETANAIDIQTFVYVQAGAFVLAMIAIPAMRKLSSLWSLVGMLAIYWLLKLVVLTGRPPFGGVYTYLTITEMVMLSLSTLLAHRVAEGLHDIEETVANITLEDVQKRVKAIDEADDEIENELARCRRYQRPLSLLIIQADPKSIQASLHQTVLEAQQAIMTRYVTTSLARLIGKTARRTDLILEQPTKNRFILLLPETETETLNSLIERIRNHAEDQLGVSVDVGLATFPLEALTFEELVRHAEAQLKVQRRIAPNPAVETR